MTPDGNEKQKGKISSAQNIAGFFDLFFCLSDATACMGN